MDQRPQADSSPGTNPTVNGTPFPAFGSSAGCGGGRPAEVPTLRKKPLPRPPMTPHDRILGRLAPLQARLLEHPVYQQIRGLTGLRRFMDLHIFAVWDFMSLLKSLQRQLCCVTLPWVPPADPESARLVNEIVLGEETDEDGRGGHASHFELYLEAMREAGADTAPIERLLQHLREEAGHPFTDVLAGSNVPPAAGEFMRSTFATIASDSLPAIAAAFTFGREDLLPGVFRKIVTEIGSASSGGLGRFLFYLDRHIALDGDEHGPMARQLVARICGDDADRWRQAEEAAVRSLEARLSLWDAMAREIGAGEASVRP